MTELFCPEEVFQFRSFRRQKAIIDRMGRLCGSYLQAGFKKEEAFYVALIETHDWMKPFLENASSGEIYRRFRQEFVKNAGHDIKGVINHRLHPFRTMLNRHKDERVCLDPMKLLEFATTVPHKKNGESPSDRLRSIPYRRYTDCQRRFAVALQYFAIEFIDSDARSSEDLLMIGELESERLFLQEDDQIIWVVAKLTPSKHNRVCQKPRIFTKSRDYRKAIEKLKGTNRSYYDDRFNCRVVKIGDRTFYVWVDGRWKEPFPTLLKLERGRGLTDRRGWKYVVVAVRHRGVLRVATHADAVTLNNWSRENLWNDQLFPDDPKTNRNPNSHPNYTDDKIVGRFVSAHDGITVSAQVEQITLSIGHHINTMTSTDSLHHTIYRGQEIVRTLCPLWFPFSIYGVDWPSFPRPGNPDDRSVRKLETKHVLEAWWRSQIVH